MTFALVQSAVLRDSDNEFFTSPGTFAKALPNPVGSGNMVIVMFGFYPMGDTVTAFSITDDKSNSYTIPSGFDRTAQANSYCTSVAYCLHIANGPQTLTASVATNNPGSIYAHTTMHIAEFTPSGTFDQHAGQHQNPNNTSVATAPSITPSAANALVWAADSDSQFGSGYSAGTGFSQITVDSGGYTLAEYQVQTMMTAVAATVNRTSPNGDDWMFAMSFTPAATTTESEWLIRARRRGRR